MAAAVVAPVLSASPCMAQCRRRAASMADCRLKKPYGKDCALGRIGSAARGGKDIEAQGDRGRIGAPMKRLARLPLLSPVRRRSESTMLARSCSRVRSARLGARNGGCESVGAGTRSCRRLAMLFHEPPDLPRRVREQKRLRLPWGGGSLSARANSRKCVRLIPEPYLITVTVILRWDPGKTICHEKFAGAPLAASCLVVFQGEIMASVVIFSPGRFSGSILRAILAVGSSRSGRFGPRRPGPRNLRLPRSNCTMARRGRPMCSWPTF